MVSEMYDKLIKRLRECTAEQNGEKTLWHQAADAIEQLTKERDKWMATAKDEREAYWHWFDNYQKDVPCWIPATERLPDHRTTCLIVDDGVVVVGWRNLIGEWYDVAGDRLKYVTHWMPLPSTEGLNGG